MIVRESEECRPDPSSVDEVLRIQGFGGIKSCPYERRYALVKRGLVVSKALLEDSVVFASDSVSSSSIHLVVHIRFIRRFVY